MELDGKVAIVTGATSGIGAATARALAKMGVRVVITGRREERLADIVHEIQSTTGNEAYAVLGDISDPESVSTMVDDVYHRYGRIDILVNNAGVMLLGPVLGSSDVDWHRMIDTNLYGVMWATHEVLPIMIRQKSGHIVQVSSVAGRTTREGSAVYNATKWGVNAFTDALRQEVIDDNIRTTLIEPGVVATELREHITNQPAKAASDKWAASIRQLASEDVAAAILYALTQPEHVAVNEILIRPTDQER